MKNEVELLKTTEKVFFVVFNDFDGYPVVQVFSSGSAAVDFVTDLREFGYQSIKFYEGTALLLRDGD